MTYGTAIQAEFDTSHTYELYRHHIQRAHEDQAHLYEARLQRRHFESEEELHKHGPHVKREGEPRHAVTESSGTAENRQGHDGAKQSPKILPFGKQSAQEINLQLGRDKTYFSGQAQRLARQLSASKLDKRNKAAKIL